MALKYKDLLVSDITQLQRLLEVKVDGKYGPKTKKAHLEKLDKLFLEECEFYGWRLMPAPEKKSRERNFPESRIEGERVIWHWPGSGRSAESLGRLWTSDSRTVSSHAGVDEKGIIWYVMPHRVSYHAGKSNGNSLGIDICSPPLADSKSISAAKERGIYKELTEDGKYQLLHPDVLRNVSFISRAINIWGEYLYQDHAYVDPNRKIDCIPWRKQLEEIKCWVPEPQVTT